MREVDFIPNHDGSFSFELELEEPPQTEYEAYLVQMASVVEYMSPEHRDELKQLLKQEKSLYWLHN